MAIFKSKPIKKKVNDVIIDSSDFVVIMEKEYTTNGESYIIVRGTPHCTLKLNSKTTEKVTIKAMTDVLVIADKPIDEEYDEIELQKGASVELLSASKWWYIMSSDGLKNS
jgi:hypothetical protein